LLDIESGFLRDMVSEMVDAGLQSKVIVNGFYASAKVGVGSTTRCIMDALPELSVARSNWRADTWGRFLSKRFYERSFKYLHPTFDVRLHPYFALANDSRAVLTVHDTAGILSESGSLARAHIRAARSAGMVISDSRSSAAEVASALQVSVEVITQYPDIDFFLAPRDPKSSSSEGDRALRVGYWGGWAPRKRAIDSIVCLSSSRFSVWATGAVPSDLHGVRIDAVGYPERVDLMKLIDGSDVAVYPSENEGYGLPVYEALLRNVPVVIRDLPSYDDFIIKDERFGVFIISDAAEMPAAVTRAAEFRRSGAQASSSLQFANLADARRVLRGQLLSVLARMS